MNQHSRMIATGLAVALSAASFYVAAASHTAAAPADKPMDKPADAAKPMDKPAAAAKPMAKPSNMSKEGAAQFKADLAACKSLPADEQKSCVKEAHSARAEGLYK